MGFSVRVLGVGKLKHIDFGSEDDQKRDWFASGSSPAPAQVLNNLVESHEDLIDVESRLQAAKAQGADVLEYQGQEIDISDDDQVSEILLGISEKLRQLEESATSPTPPIVKNEEKERVSLILKEAEIINQSLFDGLDNQASITEPDWSDYSRTPYPHQKEGILWVLNLLERALISNKEDLYRVQGGLLADDMGLGKTYMTLVALGEYLKKQRDSGLPEKPILIVAPLSLLENWEQEINQTFKMVPFKDIKVLQSGRDLQEFRIKDTERETVQLASAFNDDEVLDQSSIRYALKVGPESGANRLDINRRLVLTTYQTLRDYQFSLCVIDWGLVVFDEAQNVKNPNTLQSRAAKGLKADFKLLATGTPVENSLADFWCLTDTAQPGLLGEWQQFRDDWIKPINEASEENKNEVRQHVGGALRAAVGMFMLRRIKEDQLQGLPTKFIYSGVSSTEENAQRSDDLVTYMKGEQLSAYDAVLDDYRHRKMVEDMQGQALSTLQKLRLVSLHPELSGSCNHLMTSDPALAKKYMMKSGKLQILLSVLDRIQKNDEKVILFMVTKQLQRLLKIWLDAVYSLNIHVINGDTAAVHKKKDTMTRKKMIEDFESVSGFNIIIMSPVAAGVGLTVVGANHVIHLERHWNPAKEAQATDRVYRIGQKKDVHIHLPAVLHPEFDSFDVHLHRLLNGKLMLKDAVVTPDIVSENEMLSALDC